MRKTLLILVLVTLSGCTDNQGAYEAVKNTGLEPVIVGGYAFFGCSQGDTWHTKFKAKRQDGKIVSGVVCSGFLKGATVRYD